MDGLCAALFPPDTERAWPANSKELERSLRRYNIYEGSRKCCVALGKMRCELQFGEDTFHLIRASLYEKFKEPLKEDVSLSLDLDRIEFCEGLRGADVALFRDSLRAALYVLKKFGRKKREMSSLF